MTTPDRISMLVHELRSPLAALTAIAQAAQHGGLATGNGVRLVRLAIAAGRSIERLVSDPVFMSLHPGAVDLGDLAGDVVAAHTLAGASVELELGSGSLVVHGDGQRIRQALDNVLGNAVAHSPAGRPARVAVTGQSREVTVTVTDEGVGIAVQDHARIFEPGVRATDERPGSGIGLAVVRAVIEAHGGRVELESAPGAGATFRLCLPRGDVAE